MSPDHAIVTHSLVAGYSRSNVLRGLTLSVPQGGITALLGRNGAGKTTLMDICLGLQPSRSGDILVLGADPRRNGDFVRRHLACVASDETLDPSERLADVFGFHAALRPHWDESLERDTCERFGISRASRVRDLSRGERQKAALLTALCAGVQLILLDEPFDGLDIVTRDEITRAIVDLVDERGTTVFVASHDISEVERIADNVAIMRNGTIIADGPVDQICRRVRRWSAIVNENFDEQSLPEGLTLTRRGRRALLTSCIDPHPGMNLILPPGLSEVEPLPETGLRDVFLELTGASSEGDKL